MSIGCRELDRVNSGMDRENIRRMVLASLVLVVLFSVIWGSFVVREIDILGVLIGVGYLSTILWDLLFMGLGYYWLKVRPKTSPIHLVTVFWIGTILQMLCCMSLAQNNVEISLYWGILISMFALVPLISSRCFLASESVQLLALLILRAQDHIGKEQLLYLIVGLAMCAVISRQSYANYYRILAQRCRLSSARGMADLDALTKLQNRRGLERKVATIWPMCQRQEMDVAVIMFDIDNFKKYNDAFGHPEGDQCIKAVAQKLIDNTPRRSDLAARVGGEEFLVVLTGISESDAIRWARRCKNSIESMQVPQARDNFLPFVTVSMGICQRSISSSLDFKELCKEADRCLYQSKEHGRASIYIHNKCVCKTLPQAANNKESMERGFRLLG